MGSRLRAATFAVLLTLLVVPIVVTGASATPRLQVTITSGPEGIVASRAAVITFEANEPATFRCSLDGSELAPCASPVESTGLADGEHTFVVRAVDQEGANPSIAERKWMVRIDAAVPPVAVGHPDAVKVHGPEKLTPRLLRKLARQREPKPVSEPDGEHEELGESAGCFSIECPSSSLQPHDVESVLSRRTPRPAFAPWEPGEGGGDPNVAASSTHVVVASYNKLFFYRKSGEEIKEDKWGNPIDFPFPITKLFAPLWDTSITPESDVINNNKILNLPDGAPCEVDDPFDSDSSLPGGTFCLNKWFDARIVFDEYRKRFFVTALVGNPNWRKAGATPTERAARRNKVVTAVSLTEDPLDGWNLWWWDAAIDDGACNDIGSSAADIAPCGPNNTYRPAEASDYPSIAISRDYFLQTNYVKHTDPHYTGDEFPSGAFYGGYALLTALNADFLANGGTCPNPCGWSYWNFPYPASATTVEGVVQPARQHKHGEVNTAKRSFFVQPVAPNLLYIFAFSLNEGPVPPLRGAAIEVSPFAWGVDAPQRPESPVTTPFDLRLANVTGMAQNAVIRNESLYTTWLVCTLWSGLSECSSSIRIVRAFNPGGIIDQFAANGSLGTPTLDRSFGLRNKFDDGPSDVVFYGNPSIEANKVGDMVTVYNRSGTKVFPEVRYSLYRHNDPDIRPSALLRAGEFPCSKQNTTGDPGSACNIDTAGIAVDPWDDKGIWMTHSYGVLHPNGNQGTTNLVVGKILGSKQPDLLALDLDTKGPFKVGGTFGTSVIVNNGGDAKAANARLRLHLKSAGRGGKSAALGQVAVKSRLLSRQLRRLRPGRSRTLRIRARIPRKTRPGRYRLRARVIPRGGKREYSRANNLIVSRPFRVTRR